jgi:hypothetical protein
LANLSSRCGNKPVVEAAQQISGGVPSGTKPKKSRRAENN